MDNHSLVRTSFVGPDSVTLSRDEEKPKNKKSKECFTDSGLSYFNHRRPLAGGTLHKKHFFKDFVGREIDTEKVLGVHRRIYTRGRRCIIIEYDNDLWEFLKADRKLEPITTRKATVPFEFQDYLKMREIAQPTVYGTRHIFTRKGKSQFAENPFVWHVPSHKLLCIGYYYPKEKTSSGIVSDENES